MSDANLKLIKELYGAFARRDMPTVLDACVPDVTWGMMGRKQDLPLQGIHNGKPGIGAFFQEMAGILDMNSFEALRFVAGEDKVFVFGRWTWTMKDSGATGDNEWLHVFTLADGKITQWRGYNDGAQLLAAYSAAPAKRAANG